jgi:hypothetical protein
VPGQRRWAQGRCPGGQIGWPPFANIVSAQVYISCDAQGSEPTGNWTSGTACTGGPSGTGLTSNVISVRVALTYAPLTPVLSTVIGPRTIYGSASMVIN